MDYLVHHLLESSARRHPDRTAVVDLDRAVTYSELDRRANQVANLLIDRGVRRGDRVGLYLDKSLESVIGIYGALKAGAAYVPLDPQAPPARLAYILSDCAVRHVLMGAEKAGQWPELSDGCAALERLVILNGASGAVQAGGVGADGLAEIDAQSEESPAVWGTDLDLAYILYTSGSTGQPKGVMLSHLNALSFVRWAVEEFDITCEDRLSSHAPLHFDLSVFDLYAAAMGGAAVVMVPNRTSVFPREVTRFIARSGITIWYSVPSILSMVALRGKLRDEPVPQLRTVLFAGEVFPTKFLRQLMKLLPHARFCNLYGPTETNVCTWYDVPPLPEGQDEPIPIGKAIANVETVILGEDLIPAPRGEVGELYVRGTTVMQGYWGDAERTARALRPNPWGRGAGDCLYRTGDLVQELEGGDLRFLGRRDSQIKSRGYRIELGDIETAMYSHPEVMECAVIPVPDPLVSNRLHAYVVTRSELSRDALIAFCAKQLPRYMIPETFEMREMLPKTSTGKVDRVALKADAEVLA